MKGKIEKKLNLNKQVICNMDMSAVAGGAKVTLTWGCSDDGNYTCKTCDYECM